jgi:hypothetical protein
MSASSSGGADGEAINLKRIFSRLQDNTQKAGSISAEDFLDQFQTYGFFWIKNATTRVDARTVVDFLSRNQDACEANWSIENAGDFSEDESQLAPSTLSSATASSTTDNHPCFYASTIVHRKDSRALNELLQTAKLQYPDLLKIS